MILFFIYFKALFSKILDNFKLKEALDTGDLIYVKDYHNLNIAITRNKNIKAGFSPTLKLAFSDFLTKYTNGITCNNNFVLITCLSDNIFKKINLKAGKISNPLLMNYIPNGISKSCPIAIIGNTVFVMSSSIDSTSNMVSTITFQYDLKGMNGETNGPYTNNLIFGGN